MHHAPRQDRFREPVGRLLNLRLLFFNRPNQSAALNEILGTRIHGPEDNGLPARQGSPIVEYRTGANILQANKPGFALSRLWANLA